MTFVRHAGAPVYLRRLRERDVTPDYVRWMNDPVTNRFLESRLQEQTLESVREFVRSRQDSHQDYLFGIFIEGSDVHAGNIKIGPISAYHRRADVGLLIGEERFRGKGFAQHAIRLAMRFAFNELGLNKLTAGMYAPNEASFRAFTRAGWTLAGRLRRQSWLDDRFVDSLLVECCNGDV